MLVRFCHGPILTSLACRENRCSGLKFAVFPKKLHGFPHSAGKMLDASDKTSVQRLHVLVLQAVDDQA